MDFENPTIQTLVEIVDGMVRIYWEKTCPSQRPAYRWRSQGDIRRACQLAKVKPIDFILYYRNKTGGDMYNG